MKKNFLIILILLLTIVGCEKRNEDNIILGDPNVEYKSSYNGVFGTTGPMQGNTIIVSIITNDQTTNWSNNKQDEKSLNAILDKLSTSTKYLSDSAKKYGKKLTFAYDWEKYKDLKYKANFNSNFIISDGSLYKEQKAWIENNIDSKSLKNKYKADNIVYLFLFNTDFKNDVKPWTITHNNCDYCNIEYTNIFYRYNGIATPAGTFAHEILHQFGAPDMYYKNEYIPQEYVDNLKKNNSKDIMYFINQGKKINSEFTDLDAYYVGIAKRPKIADEWNLGKSEFEK